MRKLLIIVLILATAIMSFQDPFFSKDKIDHLFTAFAITVSTSIAVKCVNGDVESSKNISLALAVPMLMSFGKEVYDGVSKSGTVSYKDLIYDFTGIFLGILIVR